MLIIITNCNNYATLFTYSARNQQFNINQHIEPNRKLFKRATKIEHLACSSSLSNKQ